MGLFDWLNVCGAVAPTPSFTEMVNVLRGNKENGKEQFGEDIDVDDNTNEWVSAEVWLIKVASIN